MKIILTPIPCSNKVKVMKIYKDGTVIEYETTAESARYMFGL